MHDRLTATTHRVAGLRLTKRQQTWGAMAALAVAMFYMFALPAISNASKGDSGFIAGEPFAAAAGVTIVPVQGWALEQEGVLLSTMSNGPASLVVVAAEPSTGDPVATLDATISGLTADPDRQWVIGEFVNGVTDAGDPFVTVEAHSVDTAGQFWVIDDGSVTTTVVADAPEDLWIQYRGEAEQMALSVRFVDVS